MQNNFPVVYNRVAELIETLWNVNILAAVEYKNSIIELIETLWNVNLTKT